MGKNIINIALFGLGRIGQMHAKNLLNHHNFNLKYIFDIDKDLSQRNKDVLTIYKGRHKMNRHKIKAPPVCELSSLK